MLLKGAFLDNLSREVTVEIVTQGSRTPVKEIGGGSVEFSTAPVVITNEMNDTRDHLLRNSAIIGLECREWLPELFSSDVLDATVLVVRGDECLFSGFIEPQIYTQTFNDTYDELQVNCIDSLSALQYMNYRNIGAASVSYSDVKASSDQRTFLDLLKEILNPVSRLDSDILYDGSILMGDHEGDVFSKISINDLLFLGDDEPDTWTAQEVLEEMMKYLGLRIRQDGKDFRIFSWGSAKSGNPVAWRSLLSGKSTVANYPSVEISADNASDTNTSITLTEVFNRIELTAEGKDAESLVESPLEKDSLYSPFTNRQKYLTEYICEGNGTNAHDSFYYLMTEGRAGLSKCPYKDASVVDWYVQVKDNLRWKFSGKGHSDLYADFCQVPTNSRQEKLPRFLGSNPGAAIVSFGKVEYKSDFSDNSLVNKIDMTDSLVIAVNGNGINTESGCYPNSSTLLENAPLAEYEGGISGGVLSPSDSDTTNYIVISGKIGLNPLTPETAPYETCSKWGIFSVAGANIVSSKNNKDGRLYTRQWWGAEHPTDDEIQMSAPALIPFTEGDKDQYEFKASAVGESSDTISKVAVFACMLRIGDKVCVETGTQGQISDFEWKTYKTREQCTNDDEYYSQCITIGFDPKIGDFLIGPKYEIQNNISYRLGIDAQGMAIPIKKEDKLHGKVRFSILGPINTIWSDVTRRHATWFRHTKWTANDVFLLSFVSSIYVDDFEIKVYSDNAGVNNADDSDIVYVSDTDTRFVNVMDDLTFNITSALTARERADLGVPDTVKISTPLDTDTSAGLLEVYDTIYSRTGKPEVMYVDSMWKEWRYPRVIMEQSFDDIPENVSYFGIYHHPAMPGKDFYYTGATRDVIAGEIRITLKESDND